MQSLDFIAPVFLFETIKRWQMIGCWGIIAAVNENFNFFNFGFVGRIVA